MDRVKPKGAAYYISTSGTIHLSVPNPDEARVVGPVEGRVLYCTSLSVRTAGTKHLRWAGFPTLEDIDLQRTVDALAGRLNKKMANREPRLVCVNCFPPDPEVVGVV